MASKDFTFSKGKNLSLAPLNAASCIVSKFSGFKKLIFSSPDVENAKCPIHVVLSGIVISRREYVF